MGVQRGRQHEERVAPALVLFPPTVSPSHPAALCTSFPCPSAGVFSLSSIQAAISTAVKEAGGCEQEERRRRIRQLQLRWHPGEQAAVGFGGDAGYVAQDPPTPTPTHASIVHPLIPHPGHPPTCSICLYTDKNPPTHAPTHASIVHPPMPTSAHPSLCPRTDKNPVLREFATEVTKMINEAVAQLEGTCS